MKIIKTKLNNFIIYHNKIKDNRGFLMRSFCKNLYKKSGINFEIKQTNFSYNKKKLTLRGFHYQKEPFSENKIITCINGKILLVLLDINKKSKNYLKYNKITLSSDLKKSILVSKNCATAFLTLKSETSVLYYMSNFYKEAKGAGIRYNDPKLRISWPFKPKIISLKDANFKNIV